MAVHKDSEAFTINTGVDQSRPEDRPGSDSSDFAISSRNACLAGLPENAPPPTNYLAIKHTMRGVHGTYVIDAGFPPPDHLPNALKESKGKNLLVHSTHGKIDLNVWLIGDYAANGEEASGRAVLDVGSTNGSVVVNLNSLTSRAFVLHAYAGCNALCVAIPRSFTGPVTLSSPYGFIRISDGIKERLTTFSQVKGVRECFIGETTGYTIGDKESWKGSMIKLDSPNWSAKLAYIDENVFDVGFWAKLFEGIS